MGCGAAGRRRVGGQVRGLERLVDEDADRIDATDAIDRLLKS
jgi:DNA-binding FrmR family transcriptional regulator